MINYIISHVKEADRSGKARVVIKVSFNSTDANSKLFASTSPYSILLIWQVGYKIFYILKELFGREFTLYLSQATQ